MLGPVAFPRVFYRVLCKPLTSFYLAELSQTSLSLCLSETGVNPGPGEALKGVGGKWQASGFALQFVSGTRAGTSTVEHSHGL